MEWNVVALTRMSAFHFFLHHESYQTFSITTKTFSQFFLSRNSLLDESTHTMENWVYSTTWNDEIGWKHSLFPLPRAWMLWNNFFSSHILHPHQWKSFVRCFQHEGNSRHPLSCHFKSRREKFFFIILMRKQETCKIFQASNESFLVSYSINRKSFKRHWENFLSLSPDML